MMAFPLHTWITQIYGVKYTHKIHMDLHAHPSHTSLNKGPYGNGPIEQTTVNKYMTLGSHEEFLWV
jgi:hypothetical protein